MFFCKDRKGVNKMYVLYSIFRYISDRIFVLGKFLCIVSLFMILGIMVLQVFMRYVVGHPLIWPEGLCKVLFIWMSYLAAGLVIRTRGHIMMDFLLKRFPKVLRYILKYIFTGLILIIIVIFFVYSLKFALNTTAKIYELGMISEFWLWISMPIAGFFMIIHGFFVLIEDIVDDLGLKVNPNVAKVEDNADSRRQG